MITDPLSGISLLKCQLVHLIPDWYPTKQQVYICLPQMFQTPHHSQHELLQVGLPLLQLNWQLHPYKIHTEYSV